jgi:hypothetical protein
VRTVEDYFRRSTLNLLDPGGVSCVVAGKGEYKDGQGKQAATFH